MRLNIRRRLILSFLAILILETIVVGAASINIRKIAKINQETTALVGAVSTLYDLILSVSSLSGPVNNYLVTGNFVEKEVFNVEFAKTEKNLNRARGTIFIAAIHPQLLSIINDTLGRLKASAGKLFAIESPVGNAEAAMLMSDIDAINVRAIELIEEYHKDYLDRKIEDLKEQNSKIISESLYLFLTVSFLSLSLSFILAYFLSRRIYEPIYAMESACKRLAAGNMDENLQVNTQDELEELSVSFNRMAGDLKKMTISRDFLSREIEERMRIEEDLRKSHEELVLTQSQLIQAEKMETVGRLASGVAHEVKNPLAIILQGLEYFSLRFKDSEDENITLTLQYMQDAVRRADTIIRGMLDFSSSSKLYLELEDLNLIVDSSLAMLKYNFDKSNIKVSKDLAGNLPKISLDKNKIQQAFINFFINACDAMSSGGQILVRTYKATPDVDKEVIIVEIEDSGVGIPQEDLEKIYEPFYTTKRGKGGTGLGLSVTRNIIELHNAGMKIENRKGAQGTIVTVVFNIGR